MRNRHLFLLDVVLLSMLPFVSLWIRLESLTWDPGQVKAITAYAALALPLRLGIGYAVGLYRCLWRHASVVEMERLAYSAAVSAVATFVCGAFLIPGLGLAPIRLPYAMLVIDAMAAFLIMVAPRFGLRYAERSRRSAGRVHRTIIIGAGAHGQAILRELASNPSLQGLDPVAFLDDDPSKNKQLLGGIPVVGGTAELAHTIDQYQADEIVIAIPGARGALVRRIVEIAAAKGITPRIVPGMGDLLTGKVGVQPLRDVGVEDLLRRESIETDLTGVQDFIQNKVALVTGAGGSIGSELCRQIAALGPSQLLVLDHSENQVFEISNELAQSFPDLAMVSLIADLRNMPRIRDICLQYRPAVVFHAAAHKHVPLMEQNLSEAVTNNILGTRNITRAASEAGCRNFVLISTDKAVRPTSIMGCTKRVAERVVRATAQQTGYNYVSVRFGNVLGSRGSVIPTFLRQIKSGGPVTVTHPEMRRFFMTIPEAVHLVLQAGSLGRPGELFVLDMGEPVKIIDLARDLIRLSGLEVGTDIEISYTGVRPGEKLYEEVFFGHEEVRPTSHPKVLRASPDPVDDSVMEQIENLIRRAVSEPDDHERLRSALRELVPDYHVPPPAPPLPEVVPTTVSAERRLRLA